MSSYDEFYERVIGGLIESGDLSLDDRVLVVCGGSTDQRVLQRLGLVNVVISNLDERMKGDEYDPYGWSSEHAENLSFDDDAFDFAIVHGGLHHCRSPHRAIAEMLRVSRVGMAAIEPREGWLTRLGVKFGFGQAYEHGEVYQHEGRYGGVWNSEIPNYVYRFSPAEVRKTVNCLLPEYRHRFRFDSAMRIPWPRLEALRNPLHRKLVGLLAPLLEHLGRRVPSFANNISFVVLAGRRSRDLQPWIRFDEQRRPRIDRAWLDANYGGG